MTSVPWVTILLAVGAAFFFGLSNVTTRKGLNYVDPQTGAMISIGTTVLFYLLLSPFWMALADWFSAGFWVFVGVGFCHPLFSMYLSFEANKRIGPTISATFTATAPFFATLTAILFLGESLTLPIALGTLCTVVGVIVLSWNPQGITRIVRSALLFATGAAIIRGLTHTLGKFGLALMPNPMMAGFVTFSVAFLASVSWYRLRCGYLPKPGKIDRKGLVIFLLTGMLIAVAIWCMYAALGAGDVVVASPIITAFPMFTMVVALVFRLETITWRVAAGVFVVVGGVVLIGIGSGR